MSYLLVAGGILCFACGRDEPGVGLAAIGGCIWLFQKIPDWF